jgi:transposase InsO family protein
MNEANRRRLKWVQLYLECRDAGRVCRRCGISRPTLRKWTRRFQSSGEAGVVELSRRPHNCPARKLTDDDRAAILRLRAQGNGARRFQTELRLHSDRQLSLATIHKVLVAAKVKPLLKPPRPVVPKRYSRPIPGDRVQMDTMKIAPGVYQYTAVDDCSRFRVIGVYPRRNARNTLLFLGRVIEEMPFAIQRIQTDRGTEFFAEAVQMRLKHECIKFRPIPPRSPHLNGKVERSQLTDLVEFWARHSPKEVEINQRIEEWQFDYNWRRSHGGLSGKTPADRLAAAGSEVPLREEVVRAFDASRERLRFSNWKMDQAVAALNRTSPSVESFGNN